MKPFSQLLSSRSILNAWVLNPEGQSEHDHKVVVLTDLPEVLSQMLMVRS